MIKKKFVADLRFRPCARLRRLRKCPAHDCVTAGSMICVRTRCPGHHVPRVDRVEQASVMKAARAGYSTVSPGRFELEHCATRVGGVGMKSCGHLGFASNRPMSLEGGPRASAAHQALARAAADCAERIALPGWPSSSISASGAGQAGTVCPRTLKSREKGARRSFEQLGKKSPFLDGQRGLAEGIVACDPPLRRWRYSRYLVLRTIFGVVRASSS